MKASAAIIMFSLASAATSISPNSFFLTKNLTYSDDQFEGLYKYLEATTCEGPKLMEFKIDVAVS
jgi:hypothetical protein